MFGGIENIRTAIPNIRDGSLLDNVTIDTTASEVFVDSEALQGRHTVIIFNTSANDVFIGFDDTVTTSNGIPILAGDERSFSLDPQNPFDLFGISDTSTTVLVAEIK